jgi:hypothetical protein
MWYCKGRTYDGEWNQGRRHGKSVFHILYSLTHPLYSSPYFRHSSLRFISDCGVNAEETITMGWEICTMESGRMMYFTGKGHIFAPTAICTKVFTPLFVC